MLTRFTSCAVDVTLSTLFISSADPCFLADGCNGVAPGLDSLPGPATPAGPESLPPLPGLGTLPSLPAALPSLPLLPQLPAMSLLPGAMPLLPGPMEMRQPPLGGRMSPQPRYSSRSPSPEYERYRSGGAGRYR